MKAPPKKTRHKLIVDDHDPDQYLGLASAEADYKISLILNMELGLNLKSSTPVIKTIDNKETKFSKFTSESKYSKTVYELISNDSGREKLFSKIPSFDFILRIKDIDSERAIEQIINKIRKIKEITWVFRIDKDTQIDKSVLQAIP